MMNKEEMFKNLSDKDKKEVLSLISFMKKFKEQERNKELYATYEEYNEIFKISVQLNDENELLQSQLDIANKKLEKIEKYIKENACYNELKKECQCSFSSMALDNVLSIIGGNNE